MLQGMKEALAAAQEALKMSKAEASSRLASVKDLQEKLAAQPPDQSQVGRSELGFGPVLTWAHKPYPDDG